MEEYFLLCETTDEGIEGRRVSTVPATGVGAGAPKGGGGAPNMGGLQPPEFWRE